MILQEQQQAAAIPDKVTLSAAEWKQLDGLARRMAAGAKIAGAAADVAAPLLLSADLKVLSLPQGALCDIHTWMERDVSAQKGMM